MRILSLLTLLSFLALPGTVEALPEPYTAYEAILGCEGVPYGVKDPFGVCDFMPNEGPSVAESDDQKALALEDSRSPQFAGQPFLPFARPVRR